jgi:hypothetical protein
MQLYTISATRQPVVKADGSPLLDANGVQATFQSDNILAASPVDPTLILTSA